MMPLAALRRWESRRSPIKPYIAAPPETIPSAPTPMTSAAKAQSRPSGETMRAALCRTNMLAYSHVIGTQESGRSHNVANGQQLEAVHAGKQRAVIVTKIHLGPSLQVCSRPAQTRLRAWTSFAAPAHCRDGRWQAMQHVQGSASFKLLVNAEVVRLDCPRAVLEAA